jgi:hypothetical protein
MYISPHLLLFACITPSLTLDQGNRFPVEETADAGVGRAGSGLMRWEALFGDLEAQAAALDQAEVAAEVAERARAELTGLALVDRARGALGSAVHLRYPHGVTVSGRLARVGPDWLLLDELDRAETLAAAVPLLGVRGLGRYAAVPASTGVIESRTRLRMLLRAIARDRSAVRIYLVDGSVLDATIDRVGGDFVEVAMHATAEPRRWDAVRDVEVVPISAIAVVRRSG